jgi:hypothetical protein
MDVYSGTDGEAEVIFLTPQPISLKLLRRVNAPSINSAIILRSHGRMMVVNTLRIIESQAALLRCGYDAKLRWLWAY